MQHSEATTENRTKAALRLQKLWKRYVFRKIYQYLRDVMLNKLKNLNTWKMLKIFNSAEADLVESCTNQHIRFRLGGTVFPPKIYYKIYVNGPLCDINSFAPRNYAAISKKYPKLTFDQYRMMSKKKPLDGWYQRVENNGWRPLEEKLLGKDFQEKQSGSKVKYHHHSKPKRELKSKKFTKLNKLRWLQSMYKKGKEDEDGNNDVGMEIIKQNNLEEFLDAENFLMNEDEVHEREAEDLIKWSEQLNFDRYMDEWYFKSTIFINFELQENNQNQPRNTNAEKLVSRNTMSNTNTNNQYESMGLTNY